MRTFDLTDCDPGIRDVVALLIANGYETSDSGDGVSKPEDERELEDPHVVVMSTPDTLIKDAHAVAGLLTTSGLAPIGRRGVSIQATYDPVEGSAILIVIWTHD